MGLTELLTALFVALKLSHRIDWPWVLVVLPEIVAVVLYVVAGAAIVRAVYSLFRNWL